MSKFTEGVKYTASRIVAGIKSLEVWQKIFLIGFIILSILGLIKEC